MCVCISSQPQSLFWELTCCNPHESLRSSFACYTAQKKLTLSLSPTLPCSVNHEWIPVFAPLHTLHARCETAKCLESQMKYQVRSNLEIGSSGLTAEVMLSVVRGSQSHMMTSREGVKELDHKSVCFLITAAAQLETKIYIYIIYTFKNIDEK